MAHSPCSSSSSSTWRNNLRKGSKLQIYSDSKQKWYIGEIKKILLKKDEELIQVWYNLDERHLYTKWIQRDSNQIRQCLDYNQDNKSSLTQSLSSLKFNETNTIVSFVINHFLKDIEEIFHIQFDLPMNIIIIICCYYPSFSFLYYYSSEYKKCNELLCTDCLLKFAQYPWIRIQRFDFENQPPDDCHEYDDCEPDNSYLLEATKWTYGAGLLTLAIPFNLRWLFTNWRKINVETITIDLNIYVETKYTGQIIDWHDQSGTIYTGALGRTYNCANHNLIEYYGNTQPQTLSKHDFVKFNVSKFGKAKQIEKIATTPTKRYFNPDKQTIIRLGFGTQFDVNNHDNNNNKNNNFIGISIHYTESQNHSRISSPDNYIFGQTITPTFKFTSKQNINGCDINTTNIIIKLNLKTGTLTFDSKQKGYIKMTHSYFFENINAKFKDLCNDSNPNIWRFFIGNANNDLAAQEYKVSMTSIRIEKYKN